MKNESFLHEVKIENDVWVMRIIAETKTAIAAEMVPKPIIICNIEWAVKNGYVVQKSFMPQGVVESCVKFSYDHLLKLGYEKPFDIFVY